MKTLILSLAVVLTLQIKAQQILYPANESFLVYTGDDRKGGFVNKNGVVVIPFNFDYVWDFSEGLALVRVGDKYGFINNLGKYVIQPAYSRGSSFSEGYCAVDINDRWGFINKKGERITSLKYYKTGDFHDGMAWVQDSSYSYGYIDNTGKEVIPCRFRDAQDFQNGIALVNDNRVYKLIDKTGKITIADAASMRHGYFNGWLVSTWWAIPYDFKDSANVQVFDFPYNVKQFRNFSEGVTPFITSKINDRYGQGYIDTLGNIIIQPDYEETYSFSEGYGLAMTHDFKLVRVDKKGNQKELLPMIAEGVGADFMFKNGLAFVLIPVQEMNADVYSALIDTTGKIVWKGKTWYLCFPPDAAVTMSDGSSRPISRICEGDVVMSYNEKSGEFFPTKVLLKEEHHTPGVSLTKVTCYSVSDPSLACAGSVSSGFVDFEATGNHPVLTTSGIKKVEELIPGDEVFLYKSPSEKSCKVKVAGVQPDFRTSDEVYNLRTAAGNYLVNGVVVMMK